MRVRAPPRLGGRAVVVASPLPGGKTGGCEWPRHHYIYTLARCFRHVSGIPAGVFEPSQSILEPSSPDRSGTQATGGKGRTRPTETRLESVSATVCLLTSSSLRATAEVSRDL